MQLTQATLEAIASVIHDWTGLVIGKDKAYLVTHRLEPIVLDCGLNSFESLLRELKSAGPNTRLHERVVDAITTRETSFFRDSWFFDVLLQQVLPERIEALKTEGGRRRRVRIWSAGSSTGQEAYSLAMLVRELIDASGGKLHEHDFTVIGSDISSEAVRTAAVGRYSNADVSRGLTEPRLSRHFTRDGDAWAIGESLRRLVHFRHFNLLKCPADLGEFDLVLCRNVMIYFDELTRKRVCKMIGEVLHPGAWLGVGAAESLHGLGGGFESVKFGRAILYRKPAAAR